MKVDFEAEKTHPLCRMLPTGIVATAMRDEFSHRLTKALDYRKMSQADLARAMNTSTTNVSRWVKGEREQPRADKVSQIAAVLGCSFEWLSTGKGSPDYDPTWRPPGAQIKSGVMVRKPPPQPQGADEAAGDDPYPKRAVALKAVGRHFDEATKDWLRLLSGPKYEAYEVDQWVDELSALQKKLDAWDRNLGAKDGRSAGGTGGKAS